MCSMRFHWEDPLEKLLIQAKDSVKAGLHGGMLVEDLGFRYIGPVDGHNIGQLRKYLELVQRADSPVLLHVVTEKGHGFKPAAEDPVFFHTPAPFERDEDAVVSIKKSSSVAYTNLASAAIRERMGKRRAGDRDDGRNVSRQQTRAGARGIPGSASSTPRSANRTRWRSLPVRRRPDFGRSSPSIAPSCSAPSIRSSRK